MIQQFIDWVRNHGDDIFTASQYAWLVVSIFLLIRLRVFRSRPLREAPSRAGGLSLTLLAAVILLYIGAAILTSVVAMAVSGRAIKPVVPKTVLIPTATTATSQASTQPTTSMPATTRADAANTRPATDSQPATAAATEAATSTAPAASTPADAEDTVYAQTIGVVSQIIPILGILLLCSKLFPRGLRDWGLDVRNIPAGIGQGLLGFLVIYPILSVVAMVMQELIRHFRHRAEEVHETLQAISQPQVPVWQVVLLTFFAVVCAPIFEEILFRGVLQTVLVQRRFGCFLEPDIHYRPPVWQRWVAILITSALFSAVHFLPDHFVVLLLFGMALGYVYERTGNLWANMMMHFAFNMLNIYFVLISPSS